MQKCLAKDLEIVDCRTDFSDKIWKKWMIMVAQKFKILLEKEKRTVRGSALGSLFVTERGLAMPRGKQKCMETGLCNI